MLSVTELRAVLVEHGLKWTPKHELPGAGRGTLRRGRERTDGGATMADLVRAMLAVRVRERAVVSAVTGASVPTPPAELLRRPSDEAQAESAALRPHGGRTALLLSTAARADTQSPSLERQRGHSPLLRGAAGPAAGRAPGGASSGLGAAFRRTLQRLSPAVAVPGRRDSESDVRDVPPRMYDLGVDPAASAAAAALAAAALLPPLDAHSEQPEEQSSSQERSHSGQRGDRALLEMTGLTRSASMDSAEERDVADHTLAAPAPGQRFGRRLYGQGVVLAGALRRPSAAPAAPVQRPESAVAAWRLRWQAFAALLRWLWQRVRLAVLGPSGAVFVDSRALPLYPEEPPPVFTFVLCRRTVRVPSVAPEAVFRRWWDLLASLFLLWHAVLVPFRLALWTGATSTSWLAPPTVRSRLSGVSGYVH